MIHRLPQVVADAIAAGEVVERPASVVKELCENAIDSGGRRIDVVIDSGGVTRIAVTDDGGGIAADELELALARHATSKISTSTDLAQVETLGFRGEALASIAAVADFRITSRTAGASAATLHLRGGVMVGGGVAAGPVGTTVEVCDLFFNTPARLRFLRSARAETAAAVRVVGDLALCHPEIGFSCRCDGRMALRSPGGTLRDAARAVFGNAAATELIDLAAPGEITIGGAIAEPRAHRGSTQAVVLVVNRRRIHHRSLVHAIDEAYRGLVPAGRHPFGVVTVAIEPTEVDVNVHPAKREVRFRSESQVYEAVQRACWVALQAARPYEATLGEAGSGGAARLALRTPMGRVHSAGRHPISLRMSDAALAVHAPGVAPGPGEGPWSAGPELRPGVDDEGGVAGPLTALGQVNHRWLVAAGPDGAIAIVDPHAAHEKILYNELRRRWTRDGGHRPGDGGHAQLLLIPALIDCDTVQLEALAEHGDLITAAGFLLEPFGPGVARCTAVPAGCEGRDVAVLVTGLLDSLSGRHATGDRRHRVAALIACHSAVRFGDPLGMAEQQRLLERLVTTSGGVTCPHGRPTVLTLDDPSLRRAFRRSPESSGAR